MPCYTGNFAYSNRPTYFLMVMVEKKIFSVLKMIFFVQVKGVTMGSTFAPSLSNLYMTNFEEQYINSPNNPYKPHIHLYKIFLDNIFLIFKGHTKVNEFFAWINSIHQSITLTCTYSSNGISFLDMRVYRDVNGRLVDLLSK